MRNQLQQLAVNVRGLSYEDPSECFICRFGKVLVLVNRQFVYLNQSVLIPTVFFGHLRLKAYQSSSAGLLRNAHSRLLEQAGCGRALARGAAMSQWWRTTAEIDRRRLMLPFGLTRARRGRLNKNWSHTSRSGW